MPRVKRGMQHIKKRRNILAKTKGMMWGRKSKLRLARIAELKAGVYAYRDRRNKKRAMRGLWQIRISAALAPFQMSYSRFMDALKKTDVTLDRKILSTLGKDHPNIFETIVKRIQK